MITFRQLIMRYKRVPKKRKSLVPALERCPHKLGTVQDSLIENPKKPNSAKRCVFRLKLKNNRIIRAHIPGTYKLYKKQKKLNKFGVALVRGGRTQDLIGIRYKLVLSKFDVPGIWKRRTRKTKFVRDPYSPW